MSLNSNKFTCKKCGTSWPISTENPYLCYKCAYNNKKNEFEYETAGYHWLKQINAEDQEQLKESTEKRTDIRFGCLMLSFNFPQWDTFLAKLPDSMVYTENGLGKEKEPHLTVLYGFHEDSISIEDLKKITSKVKSPINVNVDSISTFNNPKFDVLKFDANSDTLTKLNAIFRLYPHTNNFKDYHPHITISYLKPGSAKDFVKKMENPIKITSNSFVFSDPNKKKENWTINNEKGPFIDDFDIDTILAGITVESENTDNVADALVIVLDNLAGDSEYYS